MGRSSRTALEGGRLEQRAPAGSQQLGQLRRRGALGQLIGELLAGQAVAAERLLHAGEDRLDLVERDAMIFEPAAAAIMAARAQRGHVERKVGDADQVQRAAHSPGLDQRAILPERALNVV
jgi:hypothetical protein